MGECIWAYANGFDTSPVMHTDYHAPAKSIGRGVTLPADLDSTDEVHKIIIEMAQIVSHKLRKQGLKACGVPILVTQQYTKGLGGTVEPVHSALGEYIPLDKTEFNGYANDEIKKAVDSFGRKNVLVFGAETHICALQTAIGLKYAGYEAMMVDDCCGSRKQADKDSGLRRAICEGISVSCCETVLFELVGKAGGDAFKTVSKLVK